MHKLDPAISTALEDVIPTVIDLGQVTAKALALDPRDPDRRKQERWANELYDRIASRARSAGMAPAELLNIATDRLRLIGPAVTLIDATPIIRRPR